MLTEALICHIHSTNKQVTTYQKKKAGYCSLMPTNVDRQELHHAVRQLLTKNQIRIGHKGTANPLSNWYNR